MKSLTSAFTHTPRKDAQDKKRSRRDTPMISPAPAENEFKGAFSAHTCRRPYTIFKIFNDLIHLNIRLEELLLRIVDTPEFQRLDRLKQLGTTDFVFRGAKHTRFEHSLGVAHLAERVCKQLREQQPELGITDRDMLCVKIAGLCHDLGHGPFSHVYDGVFIKQQMKANGIKDSWRHEDGSVRMFDHLLMTNGIDLRRFGLDARDKVFIEEIIGGVSEKQRRGRGPEKFYLYDIVNNNRSGLDVDKLDYFERDMTMTAVTVKPFNASRFLESGYVMRAEPITASARYVTSPRADNVISQEEYEKLPYMICYPEKLCEEALEIFGVRYNMHKKVYTNKAVKKIEFMICDALGLADPHIRIQGSVSTTHPDGLYRMSECIHDMRALANLDDSVIQVIKHDRNPALEPAKDILNRIERRKLYACMGSTSFIINSRLDGMTEDDIEAQLIRISEELVAEAAGGSQAASAEPTFGLRAQSNGAMLLGDGDDTADGDVDIDVDANNGDDDDFIGRRSLLPSSDYFYSQDSNMSYASQSSSYPDPASLSRPLEPRDIIVERMHVHYGLKDKNPVARLRFYSKADREGRTDRPVAKMAKEATYRASLPQSFEDRRIRVFCRLRDKEHIARMAFDVFCSRENVHSPVPSYSQQPAGGLGPGSGLETGLGLGLEPLPSPSQGFTGLIVGTSSDIQSPTPFKYSH